MIIYTAIFDNYDNLPPHYKTKDNYVKFFCVSNSIHANKKIGWNIIKQDRNTDGFRKNRYYKINSHILFDDDYIVYLDPTFMITKDIRDKIEDWLGDNDIAVMMHPSKRTIREEADYLINRKPHKIEDVDIVKNQMNKYEEEGFPLDTRSNQGGFIIRRNTKTVKKFNSAWWDEVKNNSRRDQLSFIYTSWKTGIDFTELPRKEVESYTKRIAWHH